jgi:transposase
MDGIFVVPAKQNTNQGGGQMRFYTKQHQYYCGIDLHTKKMYVCVLDSTGAIVAHRNLNTDPKAFLELIAPFREDIVLAAECMFTWYWVADLCAREGIPFVLGHALYMKAIHGGKSKNDKIDSHKIAVLLRGGTLAQAYVYPAKMRATRDLLRRRNHLVRKRAELFSHIQNTRSQYNLSDPLGRIAKPTHREGIPERFDHPSVQKSMEVDLQMIDAYDHILIPLEREIIKTANGHDPLSYNLLQTIPGVGRILALVMLYEIETIKRFESVQDFASYARKPQAEQWKLSSRKPWLCQLKAFSLALLIQQPSAAFLFYFVRVIGLSWQQSKQRRLSEHPQALRSVRRKGRSFSTPQQETNASLSGRPKSQ